MGIEVYQMLSSLYKDETVLFSCRGALDGDIPGTIWVN